MELIGKRRKHRRAALLIAFAIALELVNLWK